MLALSIRQPYAELILRGIKTAEFRSRSTTIIGERFYL
jgi:predicted transcriptional regulator